MEPWRKKKELVEPISLSIGEATGAYIDAATTPENIIRDRASDSFSKDITYGEDHGNLTSFTAEDSEFERSFCRIAAGCIQVVVTNLLKEQVLCMNQYAKLAGHPREKKLHRSLRR